MSDSEEEGLRATYGRDSYGRTVLMLALWCWLSGAGSNLALDLVLTGSDFWADAHQLMGHTGTPAARMGRSNSMYEHKTATVVRHASWTRRRMCAQEH